MLLEITYCQDEASLLPIHIEGVARAAPLRLPIRSGEG